MQATCWGSTRGWGGWEAALVWNLPIPHGVNASTTAKLEKLMNISSGHSKPDQANSSTPPLKALSHIQLVKPRKYCLCFPLWSISSQHHHQLYLHHSCHSGPGPVLGTLWICFFKSLQPLCEVGIVIYILQMRKRRHWLSPSQTVNK